MTDDRIALCQLVEKSSDADLLREMIGFAAERLMELEVQGLTGARGALAAPSGVTIRFRPPRHCRRVGVADGQGLDLGVRGAQPLLRGLDYGAVEGSIAAACSPAALPLGRVWKEAL
jgi:putative transposase